MQISIQENGKMAHACIIWAPLKDTKWWEETATSLGVIYREFQRCFLEAPIGHAAKSSFEEEKRKIWENVGTGMFGLYSLSSSGILLQEEFSHLNKENKRQFKLPQ